MARSPCPLTQLVGGAFWIRSGSPWAREQVWGASGPAWIVLQSNALPLSMDRFESKGSPRPGTGHTDTGGVGAETGFRMSAEWGSTHLWRRSPREPFVGASGRVLPAGNVRMNRAASLPQGEQTGKQIKATKRGSGVGGCSAQRPPGVEELRGYAAFGVGWPGGPPLILTVQVQVGLGSEVHGPAPGVGARSSLHVGEGLTV